MAISLPDFYTLGHDIKTRLDAAERDLATKISTVDANAAFLSITGKAESARVADSATTADKLTSSTNFSIGGGATAAAVSYNGTNNVQLVVTAVDGSKVTGTVAAATKATQDGSGNVITTTYAKQADLPSVMGGATASAGGSSGLVPSPEAGANTKFLRGDATWQTIADPTVTQSSTTADLELPILVKNSASASAETAATKFATGITVNPSTGTITATRFSGTATNATADADGNVISSTYGRQSDLTSVTNRVSTIEGTTVKLTGDVSGSASIGTTGTTSIAATLATTGVSAGTYGPSANKTLAYGESFTVPSVSVNTKGLTTAAASRTLTLPAAPDLSSYAKSADLPNVFTGATESTGGTAGLVPASSAGDQSKVLSAAGTWVDQPTFTQQQVDWNASSGITSIANKPTIGALAAKDTIDYSEIEHRPDLTVYHTISSFNAFKSENDIALAAKANAADVYTKNEVDSKLTSVYTYKGSVADESKLPTSGNVVGDVWNVEDTGMNVAWTENGWDKLGSVVDLSPYAKSADVYSKTVADDTFLTKNDAELTYSTISDVNLVKGRVTTLEGVSVPMVGATASKAGSGGFVPAPIAGDQAKFLRGDGTWVVPTDTKYSAKDGITLTGTTFTNSGVRSVAAGSSADKITVNTNGTSSTITIDNVANATKATQDSAGQQIDKTYIKDLSVDGTTITFKRGDNTTQSITTQDTDTMYDVFTGASASVGGSTGLVPAPVAGDQNKFLRADGTWVVATDTKYSVFTGATGSTGGTTGLVPASSAGDQNKFLRADGTWVVPTDTKYTAGAGITLSGNQFTNSGVRSTVAGASKNQIVVNTGGTSNTITIDNVANATNATKATQDSAGQQINKTYIKDLSVSGQTVTYTRGDGTTGTITTQDTNTTYSAGPGIDITDNTITNSGVRSVAAGESADKITVNTNGTSSTITVNNVAHALDAAKLTTARTISLAGDLSGSAQFDGSDNVTITATVADDSHNHTISNVDGLQSALGGKAPLASPKLTGTPTAPTAATSTNTTQIATTAFVQAAVNAKIAASDAMIYKGTIGSSGATITTLPETHSVGWTYKVVTAGTYAGVKCEIGDMIICLTSGTTASNADWTVVQSNIDGAVTGPASSTDKHVVVFSGATGKIVADSGFTIGASVPPDAKFTDTTYSGSSGITLTGTTFTNSGVRSISAGASANQLSVNTNGTTATITINNVAHATSADKATTLATARKIDGVAFNGSADIVHYGSCSTSASVTEKVVACGGFAKAVGSRIIVKFTVTNSAANPTLNVNSTGAAAIHYRGAAIAAGILAANRTYQFVYNGTQYDLVGDINSDNDTKVQQKISTANGEFSILGMSTAKASATETNTTSFTTGITMNPSTNTITASAFKGSLDGSYVTGTIDGGEIS